MISSERAKFVFETLHWTKQFVRFYLSISIFLEMAKLFFSEKIQKEKEPTLVQFVHHACCFMAF